MISGHFDFLHVTDSHREEESYHAFLKRHRLGLRELKPDRFMCKCSVIFRKCISSQDRRD